MAEFNNGVATPGGASYTSPLLDFSPIGNLVQDYAAGTKARTEVATANAFRNGIPKTEAGSPNYGAMAETLAKAGNPGMALQIYQTQMKYDMLKGVGGLGESDPTPPTAQVPPQPTSTTTSAQPPRPVPAQPQQKPQAVNGGTIMGSILAAGIPEDKARPLAEAVSRRVGIDPDAPYDSSMHSRINRAIAVEANGGSFTPAAGAPSTTTNNAVAQAPPGMDISTADAQNRRASVLRERGRQLELVQPGLGKANFDQADKLDERAKQSREAYSKNSELTPELKVFQNYQRNGGTMPYEQYMVTQEGQRELAKVRAQNQKMTPGQIEAGTTDPRALQDYTVAGAARKDQARVAAEAVAPTPEQKNARGVPAPGAPAGGITPQSVIDYERTKGVKIKEGEQEVVQSQKTYNGMQAQSTQFERDLKPYLQLSRSILNQPEMYSGTAGNLVLDINKVRAAFGTTKAALLQEALKKVTASSVLGQINTQRDQLMEAGGASARIFAQQVDLVEQAAPALSTTPSGNRFLVEVSSRMGELSSVVTSMARDYIKTHGHLDPGFDSQVSHFMETHPVFTPAELAHPEVMGAPIMPGGLDAVSAKNWATKMGLAPGDPVRLQSGKYVPVPP